MSTKMLITFALLVFLIAGLGASPLPAQTRAPADDSAAKTFKLLKSPESPAEYWDAVKFSLNVGKHADAAAYLDKLLASNPPTDLLLMIREKDAPTYFPKMSTSPDLQAKAIELLKLTEQAAQERARDPERIQKFIDYLTRSPQQRGYGIAQLRKSGPDAVPHLLAALADPALADHHATIVLSMQKLDSSAVPPLVAALATDDRSLLADVITVLGAIGDRDTVLHLRFLAETPELPDALRSVARGAVESIVNAKYSELPSAAEALTAQTVRYYEHRVDVRASSTGVVRLWRWVPPEGLKSEDVTVSYAEEYFGLGHSRQALALDPNYEPAQIALVSLSLEKAAERVGIDQSLPEGPGGAAAEALAAGPQLLGKVLARALDDDRSAVAVAALKALARTGDLSLLAPQTGRLSPLAEALATPDFRVQFAAAEAVLSLRPQKPYPGTTQIVPILTRALTTDGVAKAVVIDRSPARGSALASLLGEVGYDAQFVTNGREGFIAAAETADVELVFLDPSIHTPELSPTIATFRGDPRTAGIPIIVLGEARGEVTDPLHESLLRGDLTQAIEEVRKIGDRIAESKLEKSDKDELLKELSLMASSLQGIVRNANLSPAQRPFRSIFISELRRFSRQIEQIRGNKEVSDSLIELVAALSNRIQRISEAQLVTNRAVARESLPTREELTKFERRYPRVKAFLRPTTVDTLKLQLDPLVAGQQKPLTAAERTDYARRAVAWLARIARGEIRGIDSRPAEPAVLAVLADDALGPDAITVASLTPTATAQTALAKLVANESANMPLRLEAAKQMPQSLRQFGVLMPNDQLVALRELLDRTDEPVFHQAVAGVIGATKPSAADSGGRLRRLPTPAFQPVAAPGVPAKPGAENAVPQEGN